MNYNKDIGFVLINIQNNDFYEQVFKTIARFIDNRPYNQVVVFSSSMNKIDTHNVPILHLSHGKFFYGDLVLFDIPSIIMTEKFTNINNRYLYAQDIPWGKSSAINYNEWKSIYYQNNLSIIASNNNLYDIYNICWKEPIGISENFDYDQLCKII